MPIIMTTDQNPASEFQLDETELADLENQGFLIGKQIGRGSFATVHLANYLDPIRNQNIRLACKIFDKRKASEDVLKKFFPRELQILTKVEHPYVIEVHSILEKGPLVFVFMRYAAGGDLLRFIKANGSVPEIPSKIWLRQMLNGLEYLHSKDIAHRDLKCENVLLTRRLVVKLADFGFARYCIDSDGNRVLSNTYCGSIAYAAPEVLSTVPYNPKLSDVWSLGVILFIMLNGVMPFDDSNLGKMLKDQVNQQWKFRSYVELSDASKDLVEQLLQPSFMKRPPVNIILKHRWLKMREDHEFV